MCSSIGIGEGVVLGGSIAAIVVSSLGLAGICSLQTVSMTGLISSAWNYPVLVVSTLGLVGKSTVVVVSGVTLGASIFTFMVASASCCSKLSLAKA